MANNNLTPFIDTLVEHTKVYARHLCFNGKFPDLLPVTEAEGKAAFARVQLAIAKFENITELDDRVQALYAEMGSVYPESKGRDAALRWWAMQHISFATRGEREDRERAARIALLRRSAICSVRGVDAAQLASAIAGLKARRPEYGTLDALRALTESHRTGKAWRDMALDVLGKVATDALDNHRQNAWRRALSTQESIAHPGYLK